MIRNKDAVEYILNNLDVDEAPISFKVCHFAEKIVLQFEGYELECINCNSIKINKTLIAQLEYIENGYKGGNSYFLHNYSIEPCIYTDTGEMYMKGEKQDQILNGYKLLFNFQHIQIVFFAQEIIVHKYY